MEYIFLSSSTTQGNCTMMSEESLKSIRNILEHICFLKIIPCDWNSKEESMRVIEDARLNISIGIYTCVCVNTIYLSMSQILAEMSLADRSIHTVAQAGFVLASTSAYTSFTRRYELATFINHFFRLNKSLKGKK